MPEPVPEFFLSPPLRCFGPPADRVSLVCGKRACWERPPVHEVAGSFFCDEHRRPGDVPIAPDAVYRRVQVECEVFFAATSFVRGGAHSEALAQLERAVLAAGGVIAGSGVTSVTGRQAPTVGPRRDPARFLGPR